MRHLASTSFNIGKKYNRPHTRIVAQLMSITYTVIKRYIITKWLLFFQAHAPVSTW